MATLEDLKPGTALTGLLPNQTVTIIDVRWHGTAAVELIYKRPDGGTGSQLLYRSDEARIEIATAGKKWTFDADGEFSRLRQIRLSNSSQNGQEMRDSGPTSSIPNQLPR